MYDTGYSLGVRMYSPAATGEATKEEKLSVFIYFHGGGFVCISAPCTWPKLPRRLPPPRRRAASGVVLSFGYRLASEHQLLPAARNRKNTAAALL